MAAVIATMRSSFLASAIRLSPNTFWKVGALATVFFCSPVRTVNFDTA